MTARTKTLPIRISENELDTLRTLAEMEKLSLGTYARRKLLLEAQRRGIVARADNANRAGGKVVEAIPSAIAA
jgi:hypothetical protein